MEIRIAETDSEIESVGRLLLQLRPNYDLHAIVCQIKDQQRRGYTLAYIYDNDQIVCAAGFAIKASLAWGKHIYIEELITDACRRSSGSGKAMMDWLKSYAQKSGCPQIHLDSGVQRFSAHKFYLREGFNIASHHFSIIDI